MRLHVLGYSGSDLPGYNLTSFLIDGTTLLDAGSVTSSLSLVEQSRIKEIMVTHAHLDHIKDILFLADNLIELVACDAHGPVRIRGLRPVLESIQKHLLNDTIWPDFTILPTSTNPVLAHDPLEPGVWINAEGLRVATFPVNHAQAASGYVFWRPETGSHFAFTGDTGPTQDWWTFLNGLPFALEHLIIEASFPNAMEDTSPVVQASHAPAVAQRARQTEGPPQGLHLPHEIAVFHEDSGAVAAGPGGLFLSPVARWRRH